jgi:hypothetical protein
MHEDEVERLGRPTAEVLPATFDRNAPVQKSAAACSAFVWAPSGSTCHYWGRLQAVDLPLDYTDTLAVGNSVFDYNYQTMNWVALGACNESPRGPVNEDYAWSSDRFMTATRSSPISVNQGGMVRHWINFSARGPDLCGGPIQFPCYHPMGYIEETPSGTALWMRLRTAEELYDSSCYIN